MIGVAACVVACGDSKEPATPAAVSTSSTTTSAPKLASAHVAIYDIEEKDIDGQPVRLDRYAGKVLLVVNVASKCGFTPQYEGLEALYKKHESEGLVLLGFPSDQFGNQEPGTAEEIKTFCRMNYAVTFPIFAKSDVNGPNANPLYKLLRAEQPGSFTKDTPGAEKLYAHLEKTMPDVLGTDAVKWNFTKFLVDRNGKVVKRFESPETPQAIEPEIVAQLAKK
jgi:glutathione peroxidase